MALLIDLQCFPCIDYIKKVIEEKYVKIEKYESFQKTSFRNRYVIAGANGLTNLTIPVAGGREQKALITDIKIDNTTGWKTRHWRSITSAYSKAPFFDFYRDEVKDMLFNPDENLFNFNVFILSKLCNMLSINPVIVFTEQYSKLSMETDFRNRFLPKSFQAEADWKPRYSQVFEDRLGFQPNLSILDLLFCEGPNSGNLLQQSIRGGNSE